jgi:hypothetical protein
VLHSGSARRLAYALGALRFTLLLKPTKVPNMPTPVRLRRCVSCSDKFSVPNTQSAGRPARYCETCKALPPTQRKHHCASCGTELTDKRQTLCPDCSVSQRCLHCGAPIPKGEQQYCDWECMEADCGPAPLCKQASCGRYVPQPTIPKQWPNFCSQRCRETAYRAKKGVTIAGNSDFVRFWSRWRLNKRNKKGEQLKITDLPHSDTTGCPKPWFCSSAETGIKGSSEFNEDIIERIMEWTHVINLIQNPEWHPELKRPDDALVAFMFTSYLYETNSWRIMPWLWDEMNNATRRFVRDAWKDFIKGKNTMSDFERADLAMQLDSYYDRGYAPEGMNKRQAEEWALKLTFRMREPLYNPFEACAPYANIEEITGGDTKKARFQWNKRCLAVIEAATRAGQSAAPRPSPPAPVRKGRSPKSSKPARGRA